MLARFLNTASANPHLQPHARLTDGGPTSATADASRGLTFHNLQRVRAGLAGENLGVDLSLAQFGGDGLPAFHKPPHDKSASGKGESMGVTGWQDKAEFEREQEVVEGEIGSRANTVPSHDGMPEQRKKDKKAKKKQKQREENIS